MYVPRATYSLSTSFWTVPPSLSNGMPRRRATASTNASRIDAGALIVIDTVTRSSGIWSKSVSTSSIVSIATPTLPTSPRACGASES